MKQFIELTGYYPSWHEILVAPDAILGIERNVINEKSKGSIIYIGGAPINVLQEPLEIINLINNQT